MDLYAENILDHYRNPRLKSRLGHPTATHRELNPSCGDELTLDLRIEDGRITAVGWDGEGCAISQAGMSLLAETLAGKTTGELLGLTDEDMLAMLGVPISERRMRCALLAMNAIKKTLKQE